VCSGYPNPQNLVFRDETRRVVGKNNKAQILTASRLPVSMEVSRQGPSMTKPVRCEELYGSKNENPPDWQASHIIPFLPPIPSPMSQSVEERAKGFFIIQTQLLNSIPHLPSFSVLHLFSTTIPIPLHLVFAARAVSLVYFSKYHHSPLSCEQHG
jgi:hypothetical protein